MRRLMPLAAAALSCYGGPTGPAKPTPSPRARVAKPRPQPRVRPRARRPPPRRPPRPKRWVTQLLGRVQAAPRTTKGSGEITAVVAAGSSLVTVARDRAGKGAWLRGWDAKRRKPLWTLRAPASRVSLGLSADGKSMLVTTPAGTNHVYRLGSGKPVAYRKWKRKRGKKKGRTQGLSADGSMLIRGDVRGQVRGYALDKYKMKWLVKGERVFVSRDGRVAVVVRGKNLLRLDAVTGKALAKPEAFEEPPKLVIPHSLKHIAVAYSIIDFESHFPRCAVAGVFRPLRVFCDSVLGAWSPRAKWVALVVSGDVRFFTRTSRSLDLSIKSRSQGVSGVAFPTDDTVVVAGETVGQLSFYRLVKR